MGISFTEQLRKRAVPIHGVLWHPPVNNPYFAFTHCYRSICAGRVVDVNDDGSLTFPEFLALIEPLTGEYCARNGA